MNITGYEPIEGILKEIGERISSYRIQKGISQSELADFAGTSLSTIGRLEKGDGARPEVFIGVLKALGLIENLNLLIPEYQPKPTDLFDQKKRPRRVSRKLSEKADWTWGEDR